MRNWGSIALTAIIALGIGYSLRPSSPAPAMVALVPKVSLPLYNPDGNPEVPEVPALPDYAKPALESPIAMADQTFSPDGAPSPGLSGPKPLTGGFTSLPNVGPDGPIGPLEPDVPTKLPTADLNADEALARRIVLQRGGEIVASSDAKDSSGKVGRTLVAEIDTAAAGGVRSGLRKALGDRVVLSDAGTVSSFDPTLKKAEETLAAAKKRLEQARIDFLPQAPALRQIEEDYLTLERSVAQQRKGSSRTRLNVLLRSILGG